MIYILGILVMALGAYIYCILPTTKWKIFAVLGYLLLGGVTYVTAFEVLGAPKPLWLEWRTLKRVQLLDYYPVEKEAIYIWVLVDGVPKSYILPWKEGTAEDAQEAFQFSMGEHGTGEVEIDLSNHESEDHVEIEAPKAPGLPPKEE